MSAKKWDENPIYGGNFIFGLVIGKFSAINF